MSVQLFNVNRNKIDTNTIGDRFIPFRQTNDFLTSVYKLKYEDTIETNSAYRDMLLKTIHINTNSRILKLSGSDRKASVKCPNLPNHNDWPVKPRKLHEVFETETLLNGSYYGCYDITAPMHPLDWSESDILTICDSKKIKLLTLFGTINNYEPLYCNIITDYIKWNRSGDILAAIDKSMKFKIYFYNLATQKVFDSVECPCKRSLGQERCTIMALEWRRNCTLLSGCSNGILTISKNCALQSYIAFDSTILSIKTSAYQNYVIVIDKESVSVLRWPLSLFFRIKQFGVKDAEWHPWQESLVCMANRKSIFIVNVATQSTLTRFDMNGYFIDAFSWNELTGELVVSQSNKMYETSILFSVYENAETVVAEVHHDSLSIKRLVWNPDRTLLVSVSTDEIFIWKFFGNKSRRKKDKKHKNPLSIHSTNFGQCIR